MFGISYLKFSDLIKCLDSNRNVDLLYYFLSYSLQIKLQYINFVSNVTNFDKMFLSTKVPDRYGITDTPDPVFFTQFSQTLRKLEDSLQRRRKFRNAPIERTQRAELRNIDFFISITNDPKFPYTPNFTTKFNDQKIE